MKWTVQVRSVAVEGTPKPSVNAAEETIPESDTVDGDVTTLTPFPPPNSTSSGNGGPPQVKSAGLCGGLWRGIAGVSGVPSQSATMSLNSSCGKVTVWGSFGVGDIQRTESPRRTCTLKGSISRMAVWPSGLEVPACIVHVIVPLELWCGDTARAWASATRPALTSVATWLLTAAASSAGVVPWADDDKTVSRPSIPRWTRQRKM